MPWKKPPSAADWCPATDRELYDRQPGETDFHWLAFCIYRDQGELRTQKRTAEIILEKFGDQLINQDGNKFTQHQMQKKISRYSSPKGWIARCIEWDREVDRIRRVRALKDVEAMVQRHIDSAVIALEVCRIELDKWVIAAKESAERGEILIPFREVVKAMQLAATIERESRGQPTQIIEEKKTITVKKDLEKVQKTLGDKEALAALDVVIAKSRADETEIN